MCVVTVLCVCCDRVVCLCPVCVRCECVVSACRVYVCVYGVLELCVGMCCVSVCACVRVLRVCECEYWCKIPLELSVYKLL